MDTPREASGDGDVIASSLALVTTVAFDSALKDLGDWEAGRVFKGVRDGDEGPSFIPPSSPLLYT